MTEVTAARSFAGQGAAALDGLARWLGEAQVDVQGEPLGGRWRVREVVGAAGRSGEHQRHR